MAGQAEVSAMLGKGWGLLGSRGVNPQVSATERAESGAVGTPEGLGQVAKVERRRCRWRDPGGT